ncbi:class I SAM-dependent methyltransferase [Alkalihalobacillus sp. 1P02AB]|uniref:class I SAM-dependent methyltransferase n=1 Tax=Alkalihalobacillus sp. 1P02AB TaxID=3132260 RepID=UPI0039A75F14
MNDYGNDLFKGTAYYYSRYRPLYPAALVRYLIEKFSLNGQGHMLDLGCGTGQLAYRFTDWFDSILGIDPEREMIQEAKRFSKEIRADHLEWFNGDLFKYINMETKSFKLVTIAKAFHWMDRAKVLDTLYDMVSDGGGIAIIDNYNPQQEKLLWQKKVDEVVKEWFGEERRAGSTTFSHPTVSYEELIAHSKFELETEQIQPYEQVWDIDSIIGNLYSTSYGKLSFLKGKVDQFESHIKEELLALNSKGIFKEEIHLSVKLAMKKNA